MQDNEHPLKLGAPEELRHVASDHCAAIFIMEQSLRSIPRAQDRNATMTILKYRGKIYGLTCKHVIEATQEMASELPDGQSLDLHSVETRIVPLGVSDRFRVPLPACSGIELGPDVAIRQLHPDYSEATGKRPILLSDIPVPWSELKLAMAAGFPEKEKRETEHGEGIQVHATFAAAVAELPESEKGQSQPDTFIMRSDLEEYPPIMDFSGMSGGPVLWTTGTDYGLLGIVSEAQPIGPVTNGTGIENAAKICIKVESITSQRMDQWLLQFPSLADDLPWQ